VGVYSKGIKGKGMGKCEDKVGDIKELSEGAVKVRGNGKGKGKGKK